MKGCLIAFALFVIFLIVLGVGCGGYIAYKSHGLMAEVQLELERLDQTNTRWPFEAPEEALVQTGRMETFLEVRDQAKQPIADFLNSIARMEAKKEEMGPLDGLKEMFGLVGKVMGAFRDVPAALNTSLTGREMSFDEYLWITETIHLTLAKAARDGDREAGVLVESLEDQNDGININIKDEQVSYHTMRRALERRQDAWRPENLELILDNEEAICGSQSRILLDAIVVQNLRLHDERSDSGESER